MKMDNKQIVKNYTEITSISSTFAYTLLLKYLDLFSFLHDFKSRWRFVLNIDFKYKYVFIICAFIFLIFSWVFFFFLLCTAIPWKIMFIYWWSIYQKCIHIFSNIFCIEYTLITSIFTKSTTKSKIHGETKLSVSLSPLTHSVVVVVVFIYCFENMKKIMIDSQNPSCNLKWDSYSRNAVGK